MFARCDHMLVRGFECWSDIFVLRPTASHLSPRWRLPQKRVMRSPEPIAVWSGVLNSGPFLRFALPSRNCFQGFDWPPPNPSMCSPRRDHNLVRDFESQPGIFGISTKRRCMLTWGVEIWSDRCVSVARRGLISPTGFGRRSGMCTCPLFAVPF